MQSIQIKYLPATDKKGARLKATCEGGSITEAKDYSIESNQQALNLAFKLANQKLDWGVKKFSQGHFKGCDYFNIVELNLKNMENFQELGKKVFFGNLSKNDLLLDTKILVQAGIEYYKNNDDDYLKENVNKKWLEICTKHDIIIYINHLKKKVNSEIATRQDYIYFNDKEFRFFKAKNDLEARHFVINNCDLSFNPAFIQVYNLEVIDDNDKKIYRFITKGELIALRLKNFFRLFGSGEGAFCFFG